MTVKASSSTQDTRQEVEAYGKASAPIPQNVTGTLTDPLKRTLDVHGRMAVDISGADLAVLVNSTKRKILKANHGARKGDMVRFVSGNNTYVEISVLYVPDVNTIITDADLPATPAPGDLFRVHRFITPAVGSNGLIPVTLSETPIVQAFDGTYIDISGMDETTPVQLVANVGTNAIRKLQIFYPAGVPLFIYSSDGGKKLITPPAGANGNIEMDFYAAAGSSISAICAVAPAGELSGAFARTNGWY